MGQPVHIQYPWEKWCSGYDPTLPLAPKDIIWHMVRCLFEFHNPMHLTFLPRYVPSEEEKKDSILYANNVRTYMAEKTGLPTTEHTYDDTRLMMVAREQLKARSELWAAVE